MKFKFSRTWQIISGVKKRIMNFRGTHIGKIEKIYFDYTKKPVCGYIRLTFSSEDAFYNLTPEQLKQIQYETKKMKYVPYREDKK